MPKSKSTAKPKVSPGETVGKMIFGKIYPMYLNKVEKKGRTEEELQAVLGWLTGMDETGLQNCKDLTFAEFFDKATLNPSAKLITGSVCGCKVEEIEDPLYQKVRYMDKVVDELAKGKALEKIIRQPAGDETTTPSTQSESKPAAETKKGTTARTKRKTTEAKADSEANNGASGTTKKPKLRMSLRNRS